MKQTRTHAWHVRADGLAISDAFQALSGELRLTHSKALEAAVLHWLRTNGVWVFHDPMPGRMRTISPILRGDFEPYEEWAEVAPYVDRWLSPPRVVLEGTDGMEPTE